MNSNDYEDNVNTSPLEISSRKKFLAMRVITVVIAAIVLATGIGFAGIKIGSGFAARSNNAIVVTGSAKTDATADKVVWNLNASETAPDAAGAVKKVNADAQSLTKYLIAGGIPSDAITYGSVSTFPNNEFKNGNDTGRVLSYRGSQTIIVTSLDVNLIQKVSNNIGTLLQTGVNINNNGPQYYVSNLAQLRPKLLFDAMQDAKSRAVSITKAVGGKVGDVISVTSGPVSVTAPDSTDTSAGGLYDVTTIPKTVTVTVTVSFATK